MDQKLKSYVKKLRAYLFGQKLCKSILVGLIIGSAAALSMAIAALFVPWYEAPYWEMGSFALFAFLGVLWAVWNYPSPKEAALALDQTGLEERLLTAWEMIGKDSLFAQLQKKDTLKRLREVSLKKHLPFSVSLKQILLLFVLLSCFVTAFLWPAKSKVIAENQHEIAMEAEEKLRQLEKLEQLNKEERTAQLSEQDEALLKELSELKKELSEAADRDSLEKATERAEKKLQQMAEKADSSALRDQFRQMSASLGGNPLPANESQLARLEELEKQLEELTEQADQNGFAEGLDQEALEKLSEQLQQIAEQLNNGQLAQAASNLSQNASASGSLSPQSLAGVSQSLQNAISQSKGQQGQLAEGNSGQNGNGNGEGNESGNGEGGENGNGEGGSGNGEGGGNGTGGTGSSNGGGWNYGSNIGQSGEASYNGEMVSIPNEIGDDENLTGTQNDGQSYSSQGGPSLTWSGTSVEYSQVLKEYSDYAYAQLNGGNYPAGVQDVIKAYFEELNQ